jgi:hypothetical protein
MLHYPLPSQPPFCTSVRQRSGTTSPAPRPVFPHPLSPGRPNELSATYAYFRNRAPGIYRSQAATPALFCLRGPTGESPGGSSRGWHRRRFVMSANCASPLAAAPSPPARRRSYRRHANCRRSAPPSQTSSRHSLAPSPFGTSFFPPLPKGFGVFSTDIEI